MNGRLPTFGMGLERAVDTLGFVTVTKNCTINAFCVDNDGNIKYVAINNLEDLTNLHEPVFRDPKRDLPNIKACAITTFKRGFGGLNDYEKVEAIFNSLSPDL